MSASTSPDEDGLVEILGLMLDFLASKSLVAAERTLRNELQILQNSSDSAGKQSAALQWKKTVQAHNVYTSKLERRLGIEVPLGPAVRADGGAGIGGEGGACVDGP